VTRGLSLHGVSVGYGRRTVLSGLELETVPPGSLVAVIGPNAAGKSTLLKAIAGLRPASGRIVLDGEDLAAMAAHRRVRLVGYLPQVLPQGTSLVAYEAVLAALRAVRGDGPAEVAIDAVFDQLGLRDLALRRLGEMSGGQRQMVGLAQALVRRPRLLLLDEPTSALDLRWQLTVLETVRAIAARDRSIALLAMHDLNLALRACDRVVVLAHGRLLTAGPPEQAMNPDVLRRAYGIEGRVERCSQGFPIVLSDRAVPRSEPSGSATP